MQAEINTCNNITITRVVSNYLSKFKPVRTLEDACITTKQICNRCGVPEDAETFEYKIHHPDQGWIIEARAAWRCGKLMNPIATHTTITDCFGIGDIDDDTATILANDWLMSLDL